jgi:heme exporter protein A
MYGIAGAERAAEAWLERVGLAASGGSPVRTFSRGMEQRLALARALLHDPDLVLLDEPWSGLDAEAAELLTNLLREIRREGRTLITATHDFDRGLDVADRAVILHGGRIVWETTVVAGARPALDAVYRRVTGTVAA